MNKDTIYIEPEDDITDIISKLKAAKQQFVALVPPKKAGVLRSAVNIKLIAKAAREVEKVAILITADPSIIKMAAAAKLPVAADLQSRAAIPNEEDVEAINEGEEAPVLVETEKEKQKKAAVAEDFVKNPKSAREVIEQIEEEKEEEAEETEKEAEESKPKTSTIEIKVAEDEVSTEDAEKSTT